MIYSNYKNFVPTKGTKKHCYQKRFLATTYPQNVFVALALLPTPLGKLQIP